MLPGENNLKVKRARYLWNLIFYPSVESIDKLEIDLWILHDTLTNRFLTLYMKEGESRVESSF